VCASWLLGGGIDAPDNTYNMYSKVASVHLSHMLVYHHHHTLIFHHSNTSFQAKTSSFHKSFTTQTFLTHQTDFTISVTIFSDFA